MRVLIPLTVAAAFFAGVRAIEPRSPTVTHLRVPHGGIQPQSATDRGGMVHLVYFSGEPAHGNIFYVRSTDAGATFSDPIPVNSIGDSAIATGTVRGAQIAVGGAGRVHVAWNGSQSSAPGSTPMFYA